MKIIARLVLPALLCISASAAPAQNPVDGTESAPRRMTASRPAEQSVIPQSVILTDGTNWTLIPRGAVLHLPEDHFDKIGTRPVGNLLSWKKFVAVNHSWVSAEEVTLRQAEGVHRIDDRRTAFWPKQDKVVVAVHREGPIAVSAPETATASTR